MSIPDIIDNIRRFHQAITEYSKHAERDSGLTGPQLWALQLLCCYEPLRLSELADFMYLRPATVVGIIDRLERKALVTRERSHADRRAVELRLTENGRKLAQFSPTAAQKLLVQGLGKLTQYSGPGFLGHRNDVNFLFKETANGKECSYQSLCSGRRA